MVSDDRAREGLLAIDQMHRARPSSSNIGDKSDDTIVRQLQTTDDESVRNPGLMVAIIGYIQTSFWCHGGGGGVRVGGR